MLVQICVSHLELSEPFVANFSENKFWNKNSNSHKKKRFEDLGTIPVHSTNESSSQSNQQPKQKSTIDHWSDPPSQTNTSKDKASKPSKAGSKSEESIEGDSGMS
jgi:hypothetical protein